jgi:tetratricopeptide (TPR) repeat protein
VTPRPPIFISSVSKELRSARQLVANTLQFLGYEPVWQDIFGSEQGDLREVLRRQIEPCKGVVQLVGQFYGVEPPTPDEEFGRVSYTQYEALYARKRGKKVWYLILDENFKADSKDEEPQELREFQAAYRKRVKAGANLYHSLTSSDALEANVLKLRDELTRLRRGVRQWAFAVVAMLALLVGAAVWLLSGQRHQEQTSERLTEIQQQTNQQLAQTSRDLVAVKEELQKWQQIINKFPSVEVQVRQEQPEQKPAEVEERTYAQLGKQLGVDPKTLREKLPIIAKQLKTAPGTTTYERANSAYVAKDFTDAEQLALQVAEESRKATPAHTAEVIKALELAGWSAEKRIQYADALSHFHEAEKLTDRHREPTEWSRVQYAIAWVLFDQGQYHDAEVVLAEVLKERESVLGPEHPDTLAARHYLARAVLMQGRDAEAEKEYRELVRLRAKVLGPEHPDTLTSRNNLAASLNFQGKYSEAEAEYRAVLKLREKVLGPAHPDTLANLNNLAGMLSRQGKFAEAETEYLAVIKLKEKVLGAEHPGTLTTRSNLGYVLAREGRYSEAETEDREVIALQEKVLGREHPDTLASRNNLAIALTGQGKHAAAIAESRAVLTLREKVLGPDHPDTLATRSNLANALNSEGKHAEAEAEFREVLKVERKTLGPEHPQTIQSRMNLANALRSAGKSAAAEAEFREAIRLQEKVLGPEHPDTLRSRMNMANALYSQGKYSQAETEYRAVLNLQQKVLGPHDSDTLRTESNLNLCLKAENQIRRRSLRH